MMVGAARFELATLWSQTRCATRLRYAPSVYFFLFIKDSTTIGKRQLMNKVKQIATISISLIWFAYLLKKYKNLFNKIIFNIFKAVIAEFTYVPENFETPIFLG